MSRRDAVNAALAKLDKRTKILIGALLVILIGGGGYFALKSSPATDTAFTPPTHHAVATPKASAAPEVTPAPNKLPVQADPARDPFVPLPQESASAASTGTAATVAAATTTTTTGATTTSPITTPTPTPTPTTTHSITLIGITGVSATVTYNGSDKTVRAGTSLAAGVVCIKVTNDSIFVTYASKAYAVAPGQTVAF